MIFIVDLNRDLNRINDLNRLI